jgi:lysophospholipase L1-like esterase
MTFAAAPPTGLPQMTPPMTTPMTTIPRASTLMVVAAMLVALPCASAAARTSGTGTAGGASASLLKDGDTVVFFGDSITVAHTFQRAVELYVLTRDPGKKVRFINAGVGGHTASDGLARLNVDVIAHKPTVVVLNFGMNDSAYPEGTDGADFVKNMGAILDALKAAGVRHVLWADTTPYDPGPRGRSGGKANLRRDRIDVLVGHVHAESTARGLTAVSWNEPLAAAVDAWTKAKRWERLIPDRVHPSPALHAIMATQLIRTLGYDIAPSVIHVRVGDDGGVSGDGIAVPSPLARWDRVASLQLSATNVPAPLLLIGAAKDARDMGADDALALRTLTLKVSGLDAKTRYRVDVDGAVVSTETGATLARGIDVMQRSITPMWQPAPAGTTMTAAATPPPDFSACAKPAGTSYEDDFTCLWGRSYQKDQLRITMRDEKTRYLPDYVPGRFEAYQAFLKTWIDDAEMALMNETRRRHSAPHAITLTPEP